MSASGRMRTSQALLSRIMPADCGRTAILRRSPPPMSAVAAKSGHRSGPRGGRKWPKAEVAPIFKNLAIRTRGIRGLQTLGNGARVVRGNHSLSRGSCSSKHNVRIRSRKRSQSENNKRRDRPARRDGPAR